MAKTSARMAFMAPSISLVALGDSPVGVARADMSFAVTADLADFLVVIIHSLVERTGASPCISLETYSRNGVLQLIIYESLNHVRVARPSWHIQSKKSCHFLHFVPF